MSTFYKRFECRQLNPMATTAWNVASLYTIGALVTSAHPTSPLLFWPFKECGGLYTLGDLVKSITVKHEISTWKKWCKFIIPRTCFPPLGLLSSEKFKIEKPPNFTAANIWCFTVPHMPLNRVSFGPSISCINMFTFELGFYKLLWYMYIEIYCYPFIRYLLPVMYVSNIS